MAWYLKAGDLTSYSLFEHSRPSFTEDELRELRWRMDVDYIRLYGNAIAMRAAQSRLMRRSKASVINSTEGPFIIEAVDAAVSLIKYGIALHGKGNLRHCPSRTFLRLAVSFGAVAQPEQEIVDLQYALIEALSKASVDDDHVAAYLAKMLNRVFPSFPTGPVQVSNDSETSTNPSAADDRNLLSLFGLESGMPIGSAFDGHMDLVPGFGYDPRSIVSDIEEMLAVSDEYRTNLNYNTM
ncbi:uncharacterized protein IL334_001386 [Kwoniella shivajii]|uniref:C6 transcription factor n=1 Tax=Kwoniella shivajii TaxID=564305 RepID=A0ABZ1CSW9_9TREE|nr:hypothetical protein IL334_001386 [Kwoniella shivajii]